MFIGRLHILFYKSFAHFAVELSIFFLVVSKSFLRILDLCFLSYILPKYV